MNWLSGRTSRFTGLLLSASCLAALCAVSGCSGARPDPCGLLDIVEAQAFDSTISSSEAFPPKSTENNDLCVYYNANGEPRLMLFVWGDGNNDPVEVTRAGMGGGESMVIEISGVGEKAAAGFHSGELKLFAASNDKGMIGVRVRDPITQDEPEFADVQALVAKLLHRLD